MEYIIFHTFKMHFIIDTDNTKSVMYLKCTYPIHS